MVFPRALPALLRLLVAFACTPGFCRNAVEACSSCIIWNTGHNRQKASFSRMRRQDSSRNDFQGPYNAYQTRHAVLLFHLPGLVLSLTGPTGPRLADAPSREPRVTIMDPMSDDPEPAPTKPVLQSEVPAPPGRSLHRCSPDRKKLGEPLAHLR